MTKAQRMLAVDGEVDKKESPEDAGRSTKKKVQQTLAVANKVDEEKSSACWPLVDEEVDDKSPADAGQRR